MSKMSKKNNNEKKKKEMLKVEIERYIIFFDEENDLWSVTYLNDYEALIEPELVNQIYGETGKRKELIAMILGTTKIIRNYTPQKPKPVNSSLIFASVCELLSEFSPLTITSQFFYHMIWDQIEEILENPSDSVQLFKKYYKEF